MSCKVKKQESPEYYSVVNSKTLGSHFNYSRKLTFFPKKAAFACLMHLPNVHMSAICKLGKGIN